jgi:hypothetical protein
MLSLTIFLSNAMTSDFVGNPSRILDPEPASRYHGNRAWRPRGARRRGETLQTLEAQESRRKKRAKAIN